jgi:CubicO group peptidase (beta-lactamase class C family)
MAGRGSFAVERLLADAVCGAVAPGLVGAVADRAGLLHEYCHGLRATNGAQAMTTDTVFWLASMTKLVTTIAVMRLVESGDLDLDAPVAPLLPELAHPDVLIGFAGDGGAMTRPAQVPITLRHLLTHTSGLGYEAMNRQLLAARGPLGPPAATSLASLKGLLATDPGAGWTYGYGIDWAGIAIERQTGVSLDRYLSETLFLPLGMHDTGFSVPPAAADRVAATHLRDDAGGFAIIPTLAGVSEDWEFRSGGAGLHGTATDYLRLLRMVLRDGELDGTRFLAEQTVAMLWENQIGDLVAGRLDTANPALVHRFDPVPGQTCGWSLLGVCNPLPVAHARSAGSAAWAGLAGTFFWIDRAADLCGVLLAQLLPFGDPALRRVQRDFEAAAYAGADLLRRERARNAA